MGSGADQRATSATAQARKPNLTRFYDNELPGISADELDLRIDVIRNEGLANLDLDQVTTAVQWADESDLMEGSLTAKLPDPGNRLSLPVALGHRVRCRVQWRGSLYTLWVFAAGSPDEDDGEVNIDLQDELATPRRTKRRWLYRKDKAHPKGWYGHDALRDAAKVAGVKLGPIAKCTTPMARIEVPHGSLVDVATVIYKREQTKTGHRFVFRMVNGKFEVVPYRRNKVLYVYSDGIRTKKWTRTPKTDSPVTAMTGTARVRSTKKRAQVTVAPKGPIDRLGYSHKTRNFGKVDDAGDLRDQVKRALAKELKVTLSATIQVPGNPFIRRGDGLRIIDAEQGATGENSYFYATAVRHQVQAGSYTTEIDADQVDPFLADRTRYEKLIVARKAAARKK